MKTNTTIIGFAVLLAFTCIGLGWWAYELKNQLQQRDGNISTLKSEMVDSEQSCTSLRVKADGLEQLLAETTEKSGQLAGKLEAAKKYAQKLETEKSEVKKAQERLEKEMNKALAEQEVTISRLKGKLTVNILNRIMFDSGKAELKEEGQALLLKVAEVLKSVPDQQVLVIGHTDNIPVTASRHLFATNWELSAARATAAVRFLADNGVPSENLGALGYGQFHPIADNATAEGRAQNRRIEVVILENDVLKLQ